MSDLQKYAWTMTGMAAVDSAPTHYYRGPDVDARIAELEAEIEGVLRAYDPDVRLGGAGDIDTEAALHHAIQAARAALAAGGGE